MTEKKLLKSLASVMNEIRVSKTKIDAGSAGKYPAFTIDKVLEETKNLLPKYNLCTFVTNEIYDSQYLKKETKYGEKTTHNVIVKTVVTFLHTETDEFYTSVAFGEASDSGDKALSKAQTDGFKKVLCQTLHLFDDDGDKDTTPTKEDEKIISVTQKNNITKTQESEQANTKDRKITEQERQELEKLIEDAGKDKVKLCEFYKIQSLADLSYDFYKKAKASCIKAINDMN